MKDEQFQRQLAFVSHISEFFARTIEQKPLLLSDLYQSRDLQKAYSADDFLTKLISKTKNCTEDDFYQQLRLFRQREMLRIVWRDLLNIAPITDILMDLSHLADACLKVTQQFFTKNCTPDPLLMIALGKLGGQELNFSSDIDLMFCSTTDIADEKSCLSLAQKVTRALNTITEDGFVFRVDLRLRPFGQSGPLAMSTLATEMYYQNHGRPWERYALIKARIINDNGANAEKLKNIFKSFVYRHYVDYSAIDSLRQMKQLIEQEINFSNLKTDIKRGHGGIRQIEFIVQAIQLIRGGQDKQLQQHNLLTTLSHLKTSGLMQSEYCDELYQAYLFLRKTENRLQMFNDKQTHALPIESLEQQRLATSMGFTSWQEFHSVLTKHQEQVYKHFEQMIQEPEGSNQKDQTTTQLTWIWDGHIDDELSKNILKQIGFSDVDAVQQMIARLKNSQHYRVLTQEARTRLDKLMPLLLLEAAKTDNNIETLQRLLIIIDAIMRRSAYLVLLWENRNVLHRLIQLCSGSSWIAEQIATYPLLIDELFKMPRKEVLSIETLFANLNMILSSLPEHSQEQQIEALRRFHHAEVLTIASAQTLKLLDENEISLSLANLAETILLKAYELAVNDLQKKYGEFHSTLGMVAYGKLASFELSFDSDLDLVFLYETTNGTPSNELYLRLVQRILHIIQTKTIAGNLYAIDTRLRPSGSAGLLVSDIDAFTQYQQQKAWLWESQALVRSRMILGSESLQKRFVSLRKQVLTTDRETNYLKQEIRSMRERMRQENDCKKSTLFDIKHGAGGITDIEFIVQFLVLNFAKSHPSLIELHDNIAILHECGRLMILSEKEAELLIKTYFFYRQLIHQCALQKQGVIFEAASFDEIRENVVTIWNQILS